MKRFISFQSKYNIRLFLQRFKSLNYFKDTFLDDTKKRAYIFLAADYGNLGDVAITYAQTKFLNDIDGYQVIEIPISKTLEGLWFVKRNIKENDIITTVGGGNMGELYDQIEFLRQLVVKNFPNNKIVSFPQTFDFTDTKEGRKALLKAQKIYSNHNNLIICAREKLSFELMKEKFQKNRIILTPDIVLSLDNSKQNETRKGVVFCMRSDKEKELSTDSEKEIRFISSNYFDKSEDYDTHIGKNNLSIKERNVELNKIWNKFKNAELVITDRLHGMIFCYITNTPCLVFQNNNHKVSETYNWFPKHSNTYLMKKYDKEHLIDFMETKPFLNAADFISLSDKYEPLKKELDL